MIKNLYMYIILALIAIYFYCYKYHNCNFTEGYKNAKVYIGESPMPRNNLLFMNDDDFGWHSIYEFGKLGNPAKNSEYKGMYNLSYAGYYPGYYNY